jgi:hypothetical protein
VRSAAPNLSESPPSNLMNPQAQRRGWACWVLARREGGPMRSPTTMDHAREDTKSRRPGKTIDSSNSETPRKNSATFARNREWRRVGDNPLRRARFPERRVTSNAPNLTIALGFAFMKDRPRIVREHMGKLASIYDTRFPRLPNILGMKDQEDGKKPKVTRTTSEANLCRGLPRPRDLGRVFASRPRRHADNVPPCFCLAVLDGHSERRRTSQ